MPFTFKNSDSLSMIILIPNVSRLLIYKDSWNKSLVMRKVIVEILHAGLYTQIYLGARPENYYSCYDPKYRDCAIINMRIHGTHLLHYEAETAQELFEKELRKYTNVLHFDNTLLHMANQVSYIDISIKITDSRKKDNQEIQAA